MSTTITTKRDLRNWVDSHIGDYPEPGDCDRITDALQAACNRPAWGTDWAEFLEQFDVSSLLALADDDNECRCSRQEARTAFQQWKQSRG